MAEIQLSLYDAQDALPPDACMICGLAGTTVRRVNQIWTDSLVQTWQMEVNTPLCPAHVKFFGIKAWVSLTEWAGIVAGPAARSLVDALESGVRVVQITSGTITLSGVAEAYVRAVEQSRDAAFARRPADRESERAPGRTGATAEEPGRKARQDRVDRTLPCVW